MAARSHVGVVPSAFAKPSVTLPWIKQATLDPREDWNSADANVAASYTGGGPQVDLRMAYVTYQRKGAEVIALGSQLGKGPGTALLSQGRSKIPLAGGPLEVVASHVSGGRGARLVWHWYWVDGAFTANSTTAKLYQIAAGLPGNQRAAAIMEVSTIDDGEAARRLADLLNHLPPFAQFLTPGTP
jgi:EpsI family protein